MMGNIELKVGVSVPAWTYHECEHCGIVYPISRCSVKTVTEKDLMCQECWDARVISDKEDEIYEMKKEIEELKSDLRFMCKMAEQGGYTTEQYEKYLSILEKTQ